VASSLSFFSPSIPWCGTAAAWHDDYDDGGRRFIFPKKDHLHCIKRVRRRRRRIPTSRECRQERERGITIADKREKMGES
jgi:hypothetical protein